MPPFASPTATLSSRSALGGPGTGVPSALSVKRDGDIMPKPVASAETRYEPEFSVWFCEPSKIDAPMRRAQSSRHPRTTATRSHFFTAASLTSKLDAGSAVISGSMGTRSTNALAEIMVMANFEGIAWLAYFWRS